MRLTAILCHLKNQKPHGKAYRGKNRKYKEPEPRHLQRLYNDFEREEENMLILRHPYLTLEQSHGHMKGLKPHVNVITIARDIRNERFEKKFRWVDQLNHLRVTDSWE